MYLLNYPENSSSSYTVIRFVWVSAKFRTCTVVIVNGTLVEDKMRGFKGECAHFSFNKCPIYTHDGASAKFNTNSQETDNSVGTYRTLQVPISITEEFCYQLIRQQLQEKCHYYSYLHIYFIHRYHSGTYGTTTRHFVHQFFVPPLTFEPPIFTILIFNIYHKASI